MNRYLLVLCLMFVVLPASADRDAVTADIAEALTLHKEAQAEHHGWRITLQLIEEAKVALQNNQLEVAAAAASRAKQTAEESVAQMKREQAAWRTRVPGN